MRDYPRWQNSGEMEAQARVVALESTKFHIDHKGEFRKYEALTTLDGSDQQHCSRYAHQRRRPNHRVEAHIIRPMSHAEHPLVAAG